MGWRGHVDFTEFEFPYKAGSFRSASLNQGQIPSVPTSPMPSRRYPQCDSTADVREILECSPHHSSCVTVLLMHRPLKRLRPNLSPGPVHFVRQAWLLRPFRVIAIGVRNRADEERKDSHQSHARYSVLIGRELSKVRNTPTQPKKKHSNSEQS